MTRLTPKQLAKLRRSFDEAQSKAGADMVRSVRKFFGNYIARVEAMLAKVAVRPSDSIALEEVQAILKDLTRILKQAGRDDLLQEYEQQLAKVAAKSLEYFEFFGPGKALGGISEATIDALGEDFVSELALGIDQKLVQPTERLVRDSMITSSSRADAVREITDAIASGAILRRDGEEWTQANIEVFVQDSERRFARHVRSAKADDLGLEIVVFTNPIDEKTSDQCDFLATHARYGVPGFWYKDEFTTDLHQNLKDPPLVAGGHYNCRGNIDFVSLEYAISQGFVPRKGKNEGKEEPAEEEESD